MRKALAEIRNVFFKKIALLSVLLGRTNYLKLGIVKLLQLIKICN
jgi:hypothetical protein